MVELKWACSRDYTLWPLEKPGKAGSRQIHSFFLAFQKTEDAHSVCSFLYNKTCWMRWAVSPLFSSFLTFLRFLLQTIYFLNDAQTLLDIAAPSLFPEVILKSSMFSWLRINKCAGACGAQKEEWNNSKSPKPCGAHLFFPRKDLRD